MTELETDLVVETARQELAQETIVQRFETDYAMMAESFRNIEQPTEDDVDAFRDSKAALRARLITDLFSTVQHTEGSDRTVYFTSIYDAILQESYVAQRTAHTMGERFQARLRKIGEDHGLDPKEFEQFDTADFEARVSFVQNLVVLDRLLDAAGLDALKTAVLESEVKIHYALRSGVRKP